MSLGGLIDPEESIEKQANGVSVLTFRPWSDRLIQGITLRHLWNPPGRTLDLRQNASGVPVANGHNRDLFAGAIGQTSVVVYMAQVHGTLVKGVSTVDRAGRSAGEWLSAGAADGLITDSEGLVLTATVADCVPIFLFDPLRRAVGLLHAGWRGTADGIMQAGIGRLADSFGSRPADLIAYLGPSIGRECYPVKSDVYRRLASWIREAALEGNGWKVGLREINSLQALECGIRPENIHRSRYCTHCFPELFHSHRASGGGPERMAAFLALRNRNSS